MINRNQPSRSSATCNARINPRSQRHRICRIPPGCRWQAVRVRLSRRRQTRLPPRSRAVASSPLGRPNAFYAGRTGRASLGHGRPGRAIQLGSVSWLDPSELRIGLGCMRLPADEQLALDTILAAAGAGITVFDTAHAYGADQTGLGHNERLLAHALRAGGRERSARIVTKGGMTRPGGAWVPDGRAKAIAADCAASIAALDGLPIDLFLIHAPDPRTPWRTSVRALGRLVRRDWCGASASRT